MPATWYEGEVVKIRNEGPNTKRFWIRTEAELAFVPGQFITADLPIHERRNKRWRSYSIANVPNRDGLVELCIVRLEDGAASDYIFDELAEKSTITFKGPAGAFTLPQEVSGPMVMICTGTGVAPFRSMLIAMQKRTRWEHPIHLIFGTREERGILYREEFEALADLRDQFRYDIVLSRDPNWEGYQGYVHQVYEQLYSKIHPEIRFYVCGWSMMVDDATARLLDMGYDRKQVRFELYG